jgi:hypothetical protein
VFFFDALANEDHVDHHDCKDNQTFYYSFILESKNSFS